MDLCKLAKFSATGPVKKDLMKTAGSNIVLVCLDSGQVITPRPEPYAVVFVVLQGEGTICSGAVEHPVKPKMRIGESDATSGWSFSASAKMYERIRTA
jgi:hypothetical protein